jgi:hypothetical protein
MFLNNCSLLLTLGNMLRNTQLNAAVRLEVCQVMKEKKISRRKKFFFYFPDLFDFSGIKRGNSSIN